MVVNIKKWVDIGTMQVSFDFEFENASPVPRILELKIETNLHRHCKSEKGPLDGRGIANYVGKKRLIMSPAAFKAL